MNAEQKQAALELCEGNILKLKGTIATFEAISPELDILSKLRSELIIQQAALAALTAQPIELPQRYSCEGYHIDEAYLVEDERGDCFDRDEVIEKLRQQGYEVQE